MLFLAFFLAGVAAQSTTDPCDPTLYAGKGWAWNDTWTPVPYAEWGYDNAAEAPSGVATTTPCGFKTAQIQEDNNPGFCLAVNNLKNMNVQVMLESEEPGVRMCIQTRQPSNSPMSAGALEPTCGEGQLRVCFPGESSFFADPTNPDNPTKPLSFFIYADPPTAAFNFFYKVDHSLARNNVPAATSAVNNVDMWCTMIEGTNQTLWPDDCKSLDFQTPPPTPPLDVDFSNAYRFSPLLAVFSALFCLLN